ncbi:MAG: alanine--tRNA ligase [Oligoflexia bacterium]|nr:alanine--tRNA ligase [Oligoflexia bacterium]
MKLEKVRSLFIEYFKDRGHTVVPSSGLIPRNDPTLLFTNAGMNQFKDVFLGLDKRDYKKAVSSQKCVRAGGKHNDLENVGFTFRHHTFFEMLGNFSFGDYFKKEAIEYAWNFVTGTLKIPEQKLFATVYTDDDEAYGIWNKNIGLSKDRIFRFGEKDNFWSMGDTGPCGPCSEIFYDHGKENGCGKNTCNVGCDCDRFVEIWNLVFMQFNRGADGTLSGLPKPSVDTGAGLERITAVMQGVASNYDIDIFRELKKEISKGASLSPSDAKAAPYYNAVADHLRAAAFLIADGCYPSNEGAGYVLRRIIRRAIRHGKVLGFDSPFLHKKVSRVCDLMGSSYGELVSASKDIAKTLKQEEERFFETLEKGLGLLEKELSASGSVKTLKGDIAFKLYDTFGFPLDLTQMICRERGIDVDVAGFDSEMEKQKQRARAAGIKRRAGGAVSDLEMEILKSKSSEIPATVFRGYDEMSLGSKCLMIIKNNKIVQAVHPGEKAVLVFEKTPFYAEGGGQVTDTGQIRDEENGRVIAKVRDVQKPVSGIFLHVVDGVNTEIRQGKEYFLEVDKNRRMLVRRNHTATHILHYLLRKNLGTHVRQAGSFVSDEVLRFDFTHTEKLSNEVIRDIEDQFAELIISNPVSSREMAFKEAKNDGTIALFEEKYGDTVRVISVGDFSRELCAGTHAEDTSEIGIFKIISEESIGSGIRRITATTSLNAYRVLADGYRLLKNISGELKVTGEDIFTRIQSLLDENKNARKELEKERERSSRSELKDIIGRASFIGNTGVIFSEVGNASVKQLKDHTDFIKAGSPGSVIVLYSADGNNAVYTVYVPQMLHSKVTAADIIKIINDSTGGKGGGRADFAQGGGAEINKLNCLKTDVNNYIASKLGV